MKRRKYIDGSFIGYLIAMLLILVPITWIIRNCFSDDNYGNTGGLLQGTIGVAVSLAGAIVAIRIANLGTDIVNREVKRDDFVKFNEVLKDTTNPFKELAMSLSTLFVRVKAFDSEIKAVVDQTINNENYADLSLLERDKILKAQFNKKLQWEIAIGLMDVSVALENITKSPFSFYLWRFIVDKKKNRFKNIETLSLSQYPFDQISFDKGIFDLIQDLKLLSNELNKQDKIITNLDIALAHFNTITQINLYNDYLRDVANKIVNYQNGDTIAYDKRYERIISTADSFIVLGTLIWQSKNVHPRLNIPHGLNVYSNVGAALIHDILLCIPTEEDIKAFTKVFFNEIFDVDSDSIAITKLVSDLGTGFWYGGFLEEILAIVDSGFCFNKNWADILTHVDFKEALMRISLASERVVLDSMIDEIVDSKKRSFSELYD